MEEILNCPLPGRRYLFVLPHCAYGCLHGNGRKQRRVFRPRPDEIICYLSQQSVEKSLKRFLVLQQIEPPKIHNLVELYHLCETFIADISNVKIYCNSLNRYRVTPKNSGTILPQFLFNY
ncbi:MAG: HEPN domain-containing protein [Treponema sp.]|nr:HEPN domain-containing protein [Treponema sp.]